MKTERDRSTLPFIDDRLMSVSEFSLAVRRIATHESPITAGVRLTRLSPSLLADLERFEREGESAEPLEVLAACVRHARALVVFLGLGEKVVPLRLFPAQGLFACPIDFIGLAPEHVERMRVLRVEPGVNHHTDEAGSATGPLARLLWQVAMHGHRAAPLPEIDGPACYRVSRVLSIENLPADDATALLLRRMRRVALTLDEIAAADGIGPARAPRLLNALYLHAGLITLRAAPGSTGPIWGRLFRRRGP